MFEAQIAPSGVLGRMPASAAFSLGAHGLIVLMIVVLATVKARKEADKEVKVNFIGAGQKGAPPPPPPPPARRRNTVKKVKLEIPKRVEIPKVVEMPKEAPPEPEPEIEEPDDDGVEGGVEGGVKGGVVGGVVGGTLNGTVGGTGGGGTVAPPPPPARPKAKNVPEFVIKRSAIRQPQPHLSEMFKQANRGKQGIAGMYKVCVDLDGKVYEVIPVKSVPGADESIIDGLKDYWLFQPQPVPVCFLYNMPITIQ